MRFRQLRFAAWFRTSTGTFFPAALVIFAGLLSVQPAFAEKTMAPKFGYFVNQFTSGNGLTGFPYPSQDAVCSALTLPNGPWTPNIYGSCLGTYAQLPLGNCLNPQLWGQGGAGKRYYCPIGWEIRNGADVSGTMADVRSVIDGVFCGYESAVYCALRDNVIDPPKNLGPPPCPCDRAGNPMHISIGNKYQEEKDYQGEGPFPLEFTRHYNSLGSRAAIYEFDLSAPRFPLHPMLWRHSYSRAIRYQNAEMWPNNPYFGPSAFVTRHTGKVVVFSFVNIGNGSWRSDTDVTDKLEQFVDGWRYSVADGDQVETYDVDGKLRSIANRAGLVQTLTYSSVTTPPSVAPYPGLLIAVSDPFGRTLSLTYDIQGRMATMTDPAGGVYSYAYDANDNLITATYPDSKVRTYLYGESGLSYWPFTLTGIIDENGDRFATWKYQNLYSPLVTYSEHAGGVGATILSVLNSSYTASSVTDALNIAREYDYIGVQGSAKFTGINVGWYFNPCPSCSPLAQSWDANGFLASSKDWNSNLSCFSHDTRGLENVRVEGLAGTCPTNLTLTSVPSAAPARKITTQWHATWRLPVTVAEPQRITTNVYNGDNGVACGATGALCSKTVQATTDTTGALGFGATASGNPRIWTYTYNTAGQMLTVDGPRTDANDVTAYTYDARGNIATVTNALGQVTQFTAYDANGKSLTIVDPNGLTTTLAYDARQRLSSRNVGGEITSYSYDGVGQVTRVTLPDGSYLAYTYDAAHRLTQMTDNLGNKIVYTLDAMSNRTQEQVFDPNNSLAQTRSRVYSNLNRLVQEIGAQGQTTQYAYDNQGNVTSITDPLNRVTANIYDALNRLKQVTDPGTGLTKHGYNGLDQLTQVTDPRNLVTGYTVDGLGNLTQQTSPDTGTSASTYDAAGNLLARTDAKGQVTSYVYDALNRVTGIAFHDGSKQTYAYDQGANGIGRLTQITETDPANQVTNQIAYAYDQKGRVLTETRTIASTAYVNAYSYDSAGRLSGVTYPSGRTVAYSFDALGRIAGITTTRDGDTKTVVSSVAYQPFGGVTSITYGNGQTYTRQYDQDGRIAAYTLGATQYNLGYDAASRIGFIAENGNAANTNNYGYDALDRLTQATLPAASFGYGYDAVGNRLTKTAGANTDTYAYGAASNRISSITPASGPVRNFQFDANGSTVNDAVNQYAYDTRGRLIQATTGLGAASYQVNALGQRVQKSVPGANGPVATVFHYDSRGRLIAESAADGLMKREYLYLNDLPVGVLQ